VLLREPTSEIGSTYSLVSEHRYSASHHSNPSEKYQHVKYFASVFADI